MKETSVLYEDNNLTINLPGDPERVHNKLMHAVVNTLKFQMESDQLLGKQIRDGNICLLDLLGAMIPEERQLEKAMK